MSYDLNEGDGNTLDVFEKLEAALKYANGLGFAYVDEAFIGFNGAVSRRIYATAEARDARSFEQSLLLEFFEDDDES